MQRRVLSGLGAVELGHVNGQGEARSDEFQQVGNAPVKRFGASGLQVENGYDSSAGHERNREFALHRRNLAYVAGLPAHVVYAHGRLAPHRLARQPLAWRQSNGSRQILAVADRVRDAQLALVVRQEQGIDFVVDDLAHHGCQRDHQLVEIEGMGCRSFGSL